jgi:adenine-specific DNA-methyltransferase
MCTAFRGRSEAHPNLTIKKITKEVVLGCEWGRDDYSLEVANLGPALPKPGLQGSGLED